MVVVAVGDGHGVEAPHPLAGPRRPSTGILVARVYEQHVFAAAHDKGIALAHIEHDDGVGGHAEGKTKQTED